MPKAAHLFDIESAEALHALLTAAAKAFLAAPTKRTQDLLFLVFGLTHLREWIAPNYDTDRLPATPEEKFSRDLSDLPSYQLLKHLCNRSKHMRKQLAMGALRGKAPVDDWPDIDSVQNFDEGPPEAYFVEGRDVDDVLRDVLAYYERWFTSCPKA